MEVPAGADASKVCICQLLTSEAIIADYVFVDQYRKCRDHPTKLQGGVAGPGSKLSLRDLQENYSPTTPLDVKFVKRACWYGAAVGCSQTGWCYSRCGAPYSAGKWCWTAANYGNGPWARFSVDKQCLPKTIFCSGGCDCNAKV